MTTPPGRIYWPTQEPHADMEMLVAHGRFLPGRHPFISPSSPIVKRWCWQQRPFKWLLASATTFNIAVKAYTQQQDRRQARLTPAYDVVIQRGTDEFIGLVLAFETHSPQRCNYRHQFGIQGIIDYPVFNGSNFGNEWE